MNRKKTVLAALAACLMPLHAWAQTNTTGGGEPPAGDPPVPLVIGSGWQVFGWGAGEPAPAAPEYTIEGGACIRVTDAICYGDQFTLSDNDVQIGTTSVPTTANPPTCEGNIADPETAFADPDFSSGTFVLGGGSHLLSLVAILNPFDVGNGYIIAEGIETCATSRTTFEVTKDFTDGNPNEVEVTISCNTGLPLEQSSMISEGESVEFVVVDFDSGEMDCEITESVPAGYEADYFDGAASNDTGCLYEGVVWGEGFSCAITNTPGPVDVVIDKDWVIEGSSGEDDGINQEFRVDLFCDSEILEGSQPNGQWHAFAFGDGDETLTFHVIPGFPDTECTVIETVFDSAVESDNGCGTFAVSAGDGHECTITNTVFFEGIPTLDRYGLAVLLISILGLGALAYRRFA